jgi:hypothetical protein
MAWSESKVFTQFILDPLVEGTSTGATGYTGIESDTVKVALFDSSITPDRNAAVASTGYNTGQWLTSDEVSHANWPAGGQTLATDDFTAGSGFVMYDAADLAGAGTLTLTDANGCLVYDDSVTAGTVADQGICYNWFGGAQTVTGGTFTIVWHANGVFRITT